MNNLSELTKLAELRARTDRDLVAVLRREVQLIRASCNKPDRALSQRLTMVRSLLALLESSHPEGVRLRSELETLLRPCDRTAAAA